MNEIQGADPTLSRLLPPVDLDAGKVYRPSQFAVPFECGGKQYVFNTLTKQCLETVLPVSARAGEGHDDLIRSRFLVPEDKDECRFYCSVITLAQIFSRKKDFQGYTILPTTGCNARCFYCYEKDMKPVTMTPETVEQTIRFILGTHRKQPVSLSWFGGEPLLCPGIIDRICEGLRAAGVEYVSGMVTNGSLITSGIIGKMAGDWKLGNIQVSMDGCAEDYAARKRYLSSRDEYPAVLEAISAMAEAGIDVQIRCNVDPDNWSRIPRFIEELRTGLRQREKIGIDFVPLYHVQASGRSLPLREGIIRMEQAVRDAGFRAVPFGDVGSSLQVHHCMANSGGVVISPDGGLYACEQCPPRSRFGDIWNGVTDEAAWKEFCRTDRIREKCRRCPYLPYCTGFSSCPVQEEACREVHALATVHLLKRMVTATGAATDKPAPACHKGGLV